MLRPFAFIILASAAIAAVAFGAAAAEPLRLAQATPPAKAKAAATAAPQAGADDSALRQRIDQLEAQLVDMQVVIGTLESLARGGGGAAPAADGGSFGGGGGADSVRIDGLETQLRALAAQVQQLTDQVRALGGQPRRSDAAPMPDAAPGQPAPSGFASSAPAADDLRFGSTTVTAATGDTIGGLIENDAAATAAAPPAAPAAPAAPGGAAASPAPEMAALPPAFGAATAPGADNNPGGAKQLYETAYGYLMQRDYSAAQGAFEDFLNRYPQDSLAGNAQYWLGEAHFVRGEYKAAAGSFLKGYQNYAGNPRAADSLLKLAMSLDRLGQKDAACSSFGELSTRFPNAPENVKMRAKSERQRIGCS
ncbi:Cell division coordinator CpoB [Hyphomicrobium sp. 1Nfss2.1]|uniref:tol-pal system protein YbgF n=1 Tax=Hyphomicrobium sp. 1Nfss2.1 TaxID=3413936 RepID=UPI003C7A8921